MEWTRSTHRRGENCIKSVFGKHEGKSPNGRTLHRKETNIKMDFKEIRCEDVEGIRLF
jgi:hypothetical protein